MGVLFKNAEAIEVLRAVDTLVIDKTGTLTEGRPKLTRVLPAGVWEEQEVLRLAASLERGSEHPLAAAILAGANDRNLALATVNEFVSHTGRGVSGRVDGRSVELGSVAIVTERRLDLGGLNAEAERMRTAGDIVMCVVVDGALAGLIAVADPIKATTAEAIRELHADGIRLVMLTGDSRTTARAVAKELAIDDVIAEVLPDQKVAKIKELQATGRVVAMAGDGINDAPAIAREHH